MPAALPTATWSAKIAGGSRSRLQSEASVWKSSSAMPGHAFLGRKAVGLRPSWTWFGIPVSIVPADRRLPLRRALAEATHHAAYRHAFGRRQFASCSRSGRSSILFEPHERRESRLILSGKTTRLIVGRGSIQIGRTKPPCRGRF